MLSINVGISVCPKTLILGETGVFGQNYDPCSKIRGRNRMITGNDNIGYNRHISEQAFLFKRNIEYHHYGKP